MDFTKFKLFFMTATMNNNDYQRGIYFLTLNFVS